MEVHPTQVACGVVTLVIPLASLASFAIRKKGFVGRRIDSYPYLTRFPVDAIGMATQFMLTAEAFGIVITRWTLQPQYSSRRCLRRSLKCRRGDRSVNRWRRHDRLLRWWFYRVAYSGLCGSAGG